MAARYLDKNSHEPLYRQLAKLLVSQIHSGDYKAGNRLPSERELSQAYKVSRITARQAIDLLFEDGLIFREQGRGTFVAEPRMRHLQGLTSRIGEYERGTGGGCLEADPSRLQIGIQGVCGIADGF